MSLLLSQMRTVFVLFVLMSSAAFIAGCSGQRKPSTKQPRSQQPLPSALNPAARRRGALKPGERVPVLSCAGWINGPPPSFGESKHSLVVVDVWGQWCSEVPKSIPGLKQLHKEYGPKGVAFISLTTEDRAVVQHFVSTHGIPWSSGYKATLEMIDAIGASNEYASTPGYEVKPILYLVDSDYTVVWSDNSERMDHRDENKARVISALRKALQNQLENGSSRPRKKTAKPE